MKKWSLMMTLIPVLTLASVPQIKAEARRDGGEDVLRKAQYMIRQLSQEKSELQSQVLELQGRIAELTKEQDVKDAHMAKTQRNNERLLERVQSDTDKFKTLLERYRETLKTLRQSNLDNQYLVKAVQEREQWIEGCQDRNQGLFAVNSDLLARYEKAATRFSEPLTGLSTVSVENEAQEYRFKLEDLQVTRFNPTVDVATHVQKLREVDTGDTAGSGIN